MTPLHLHDMSLDGLRDFVVARGEPEYRFRQLAKWLYEKLATDVSAMTDLPLALRESLASACVVTTSSPVNIQESRIDGTRKYLFTLSDGARVESVLMPYDQRTTLCVSSQIGCPLDCVFCETAKGRFGRNLTAGEIVDQVCTLKADAGLAAKKINVVFMGMGEPLLNLEAVCDAIRILNDPRGLDLGARRITVSTSSFPDRIRALADSNVLCSLALSLNAPTDETRSRLMPKAARFPIAELLDAAAYFVNTGRRRATLEYVLLSGVNTSDDDAEALGRLVQNRPFKLNLIPYNPGRSDTFAGISDDQINRFVKRLIPFAPTVTVRRSRGADIDAACGQLWTQSLSEKENPVEGANS